MRYLERASLIVLSLFGTLGCQAHNAKVASQPLSVSQISDQSGQSNSLSERKPLHLPLQNARIVVLKSTRKLELYAKGELIRTYNVGLGLNPVPDKTREGDRATPEGDFYIFARNSRSAFYLSLGISYPNIEDAERGLKEGLISKAEHDAIVKAIKGKKAPPQHTALGGQIYIHGNGAGSDWT